MAIAFEAARHVPGEDELTLAFARAAATAHRPLSPPHVNALVDLLKMAGAARRLEAGINRVQAAQRIVREREGEGREG